MIRELRASVRACEVPDGLVQELYRASLRLMREALVSGRSVGLMGIGCLEPYRKRGSKYRDPMTGRLKRSSARIRVRFVLSNKLRDAMNSDE